jgi:ABC-type phosphate transport system permease subunit
MKRTIFDSRRLSQRTAFMLLGLATAITVAPVLFIIIYTIARGGGAISWDFIVQFPSQAGKAGGILPAIVGTFYLMLGTLVVALPIGVLAAIYLTEYARDNWLTRLINGYREPGRSAQYRAFGLSVLWLSTSAVVWQPLLTLSPVLAMSLLHRRHNPC